LIDLLLENTSLGIEKCDWLLPGSPVILGEVSGLFGVNGEVRVFDFSRRRGDILNFDPWMIGKDKAWQQVSVLKARHHQATLVAQLEGFSDRDVSRELIGATIAIRREQLPELDDGEYYWHQLEGLLVINESGDEFGIVEKMLETGANDVLVVRGSQQLLIPYTSSTIINVDLLKRQIRVNWGLDY
jgi:16S rRNA processing protein RimM